MTSHILYKHTDTKPFACETCKSTFVRWEPLETHVKFNHGRQSLEPHEKQRNDVIYNRAKQEANNCAWVEDSSAASDPAPAQPVPMQFAPMQFAPMQFAPMQFAPMQPAPMQPAPMQFAPTEPAPMQFAPMQPAPIQPGPPGPAQGAAPLPPA
ncbi:hypothetical protein VTO58DRAFT_102230 [Aureobasidium pullulans]|nr:hypothetical protein JADG_008343 [Aureobasidium pullulans]